MTENIDKAAQTASFSTWWRAALFFSTLSALVLICAFGYGFFQLTKVKRTITHHLSSLQEQSIDFQKTSGSLQQVLSTLQHTLQQLEQRVDEQEKAIDKWRMIKQAQGGQWHVMEAQYLVKLANDQLTLGQDFPAAIALLHQAEAIMAQQTESSALAIQKSIEADLAALQNAPVVDVGKTYEAMAEIDQHIGTLPLQEVPLVKSGESKNGQQSASSETGWRAWLARFWQAMSDMVIVRHGPSAVLPLVLPEEKHFLYQNAHAQMACAMWGLLHANNAIYHASLSLLVAWVQLYFEKQAPSTQAVIEKLQALQQLNIAPPIIALKTTQAVFDQYVAGKEKETR